ncbi:Gfo/Idh/MocA family protein [Sinorhizobium americanum]|uniref:Oxidoreductase, Gfo/Idh/MocA family n=1 Tax=Sinorhizobium americanum TaxID=194963 RepID=A0A1L3LZ04_9HYPH|nr:Gfo/Idh/MocA family oxidoreductase [Sinorhizobium americanum]APG95304.1 oxidoreductase, Gfo/Idh/MocA family [Sinorhizobium americanum]
MKLAIIGLGRVAELHVQALRQLGSDIFIGGWSRSLNKAEEFCRRFGGTVYATLEDLLSDKQIDAVLVATSTASHFEYAKRSILAGKHVLLEKPLCERASQIKELAVLAKAHNRICMPSHNYVYAESMRRLNAHIKNGNLGDIVSFWAIYNKRHDASIGEPDLTMRELMGIHPSSAAGFWVPRVVTSVHGDR